MPEGTMFCGIVNTSEVSYLVIGSKYTSTRAQYIAIRSTGAGIINYRYADTWYKSTISAGTETTF